MGFARSLPLTLCVTGRHPLILALGRLLVQPPHHLELAAQHVVQRRHLALGDELVEALAVGRVLDGLHHQVQGAVRVQAVGADQHGEPTAELLDRHLAGLVRHAEARGGCLGRVQELEEEGPALRVLAEQGVALLGVVGLGVVLHLALLICLGGGRQADHGQQLRLLRPEEPQFGDQAGVHERADESHEAMGSLGLERGGALGIWQKQKSFAYDKIYTPKITNNCPKPNSHICR